MNSVAENMLEKVEEKILECSNNGLESKRPVQI